LLTVPSHPGTLAPIKTDHRIRAFLAPATEACQVRALRARERVDARGAENIAANWGEAEVSTCSRE